MPIIQFIGKIFPEVCQISMKNNSITWKSPNNSLDAIFNIEIKDSLVLIECSVNKFLQADFDSLFGVAYDFVHACIDLIAFATAKSFNVILETFIDPTGERSPILITDPNLHGLCTVYNLESLSDVMQIIIAEPPIFIALNELIMSISDRHGAPARCARVIEGIKKIIAPPQTKRDEEWLHLHKNLCTEKSYLELITEYSKGPRHGDRSHIPGNITREITRRTWIVMNRFLEFRKRGSMPLPETEFPILN